MHARHWITLALLIAAITGFGRMLIERQETTALRSEIEILQQETKRLAQLRADRERLIAEKVSDAELQRLRADRAALVRLRNEISTLEANADRMTKNIHEPDAAKGAAHSVKLSLAGNGGLSLDGEPIDQSVLRQHLTKYAGKSEPVEISLQLASAQTSTDAIKSTVEGIVRLSKELGLKFSMRFEKPPR
jgi:hypothetical protein